MLICSSICKHLLAFIILWQPKHKASDAVYQIAATFITQREFFHLEGMLNPIRSKQNFLACACWLKEKEKASLMCWLWSKHNQKRLTVLILHHNPSMFASHP